MNSSHLLMEVCEKCNFSRCICFQSMQTSKLVKQYDGNAPSVYGPQPMEWHLYIHKIDY